MSQLAKHPTRPTHPGPAILPMTGHEGGLSDRPVLATPMQNRRARSLRTAPSERIHELFLTAKSGDGSFSESYLVELLNLNN